MAGFDPTPTPSQAVPLQMLPDCVADGMRNSSDQHGMGDAAQLGWKGKPRMALPFGNFISEIVPMIPCTNRVAAAGNAANTKLYFGMLENRVQGSGLPSSSATAGRVNYIAKCFVNGAVITLTVPTATPAYISMANVAPGGPLNATMSGDEYISQATCPQLVSVTAFLATQTSYGGEYTAQQTWTWNALDWRTKSGGYVRSSTPNGILPPGVELPIVCELTATGGDIVELTRTLWVSASNLPGCWFIPVGWDRAAKIESAWSGGAAGQLSSAFKSAVPGTISCGVGATIPFFSGPIVLDTCAVDVAPGWVKVTLGWVFVLGVGALIVRRIFWVVGSR